MNLKRENKIDCEECICLSICLSNIKIEITNSSFVYYTILYKNTYARCSYFREQMKTNKGIIMMKRYFIEKKGVPFSLGSSRFS
jgi:hypothetical protein